MVEEIDVNFRNQETIVINRGDYESTMKKILEDVGSEECMKLAKIFRENIILELKSLPAMRSVEGMPTTAIPLSEQISKRVSQVKFTKEGGKFKASIEIDHPLAYALDVGTGIYGPEGRPITPKNRRYMFIPGLAYRRGYEIRKMIKAGTPEVEAKQIFRAALRGLRTPGQRRARRERIEAQKQRIGRMMG